MNLSALCLCSLTEYTLYSCIECASDPASGNALSRHTIIIVNFSYQLKINDKFVGCPKLERI